MNIPGYTVEQVVGPEGLDRVVKALVGDSPFVIIRAADGKPLNLNNHGKATRWAFSQPRVAAMHVVRASAQLQPALLATQAGAFRVTKEAK